MIRTGLVSVTFRHLSVEQVVRLAESAALEGIEWGGDVHVPHGDMAAARAAGRLTRQAGLAVAAYGSYYRVGHSESEALTFESVLDTAEELGSSLVRVWAGRRDAEQADRAYWQTVVDDSRRIADLAMRRQVRIVYEFHGQSLTNTYASCRRLLEAVDHPNVQTYWQPLHGAGVAANCAGIDRIRPWIAGAHVFHWWPQAGQEHPVRYPLAQGREHWSHYLAALKTVGRDLFALMEFVCRDDPDQFLADAEVFRALVAAG